MAFNKRKLNTLFIKTNLHRLSDETLEKLVVSIEDEVDESIDKELAEDDDK